MPLIVLNLRDVKQLNELLVERARLGVREPPVLVADRPVRAEWGKMAGW